MRNAVSVFHIVHLVNIVVLALVVALSFMLLPLLRQIVLLFYLSVMVRVTIVNTFFYITHMHIYKG